MKRVYANEKLCVNCRLCEVYCRTAHSATGDVIKAHKTETPPPVARITVYGDKMVSAALGCRHCDEPKCVEACITGAMHKDKNSGAVLVDESKCVGCMTCLAVCPYGCIKPAAVALKCDLCGGDPQCVKNCPNRALIYTDLGGEVQ